MIAQEKIFQQWNISKLWYTVYGIKHVNKYSVIHDIKINNLTILP